MAWKTFFLAIAVLSTANIAIADSANPRITPAPELVQPRQDSAAINAIVPTESGQIGINPVSEELGNPDDYVLTALGPDNSIVTWDGKVYHYIEGHTNYLTLETTITTVIDQPSTITSSVKVAVETAAASGPDQQSGDIAITFSEDIANALRQTADEAIQACSLKKRSLGRRLDSVSCIIDAAVKASGSDGPLDAVTTDAFWESINVSVAQNAPEYLTAALAVLTGQAQKNKALIILSATLVGVKVAGPIAVVNIPAKGVGHSDSDDDSNDDKCDPSKPADKDSPICSDQDCQGEDDSPTCTVDPNKDCACLLLGEDAPPQENGQPWWDEQQAVMASVDANHGLLGTAAPSCSLNSAGDAFDGKPAATPASWCVCNGDGVKRIYPTIDATSSPCAYTTSPTATISPVVTATGDEVVTSCRTSSISGTGVGSGPYCTCNDNSMYLLETWTDAGTAVTGCTATRTSKAAATPTPTCNVDKKFTITQDSLVSAGSQFCSDNDGQLLSTIPINPYSNGVTGYGKDGASSGGQLYLFAYLDKDCTDRIGINSDDCEAAFQSIFDRCDEGADMRQGGAASINCQWYNITAVDQCMGSTESFEDPGSCDVGNLPPYYGGWPLGTIPA